MSCPILLYYTILLNYAVLVYQMGSLPLKEVKTRNAINRMTSASRAAQTRVDVFAVDTTFGYNVLFDQ